MLGSQVIESSELCRNHDEQFTTNRGIAEVNEKLSNLQVAHRKLSSICLTTDAALCMRKARVIVPVYPIIKLSLASMHGDR
jgi:hypothetical protein